MAWDTDYVLEGLFTFGAPLNIWQMELVAQAALSDPLPYNRIQMNIDDGPNLWSRLMGLLKSSWSVPRLLITQVKVTDHIIEHATLFSLQRNYPGTTRFGGGVWPGPTLGISFDKTAQNEAAVKKLFNYTGYHKYARDPYAA